MSTLINVKGHVDFENIANKILDCLISSASLDSFYEISEQYFDIYVEKDDEITIIKINNDNYHCIDMSLMDAFFIKCGDKYWKLDYFW